MTVVADGGGVYRDRCASRIRTAQWGKANL